MLDVHTLSAKGKPLGRIGGEGGGGQLVQLCSMWSSMTQSWKAVVFHLIVTPSSCEGKVGAMLNEDIP